MFLHGGYWRALDKSDLSFVAAPFLAQGIAVAVVNYDLCPDVSHRDDRRPVPARARLAAREGATHGASVERIVVGGHSAGGHLAAMLFATDWAAAGLARDPIAGGVSLSGVHDLRPLVLFSFNTRPEARRSRSSAAVAVAPAPALDGARCCSRSGRTRPPSSCASRRPHVGRVAAQSPARETPRRWSFPAATTFSVVVDYADADSELVRRTLALF